MSRALAPLAALALAACAPEAPPDSLHAFFADSTMRVHSPEHGARIEYHAPDGRSYLWYAGSVAPVQSQWQIQGADICYKSSQQNPARAAAGLGDSWLCTPSRRYFATLTEAVRGDPFGLASGAQPFALPRTTDNESLAALHARIGAPAPLAYLTPPTIRSTEE